MYENMETQQRITEAKRLTERLVDHTQYLIDIHENNAIVLYSDTLSKQVPKSYAANAFNVFREAMHQIEVVRICALWDSAHIEREGILTVIALIDDQKVLDALAEQARARHPAERGNQQAERAMSSLKSAIKQAKDLRTSAQLISIRNLRDKHVAHYLGQTAQEKKNGCGSTNEPW
jgi:AbiU2